MQASSGEEGRGSAHRLPACRAVVGGFAAAFLSVAPAAAQDDPSRHLGPEQAIDDPADPGSTTTGPAAGGSDVAGGDRIGVLIPLGDDGSGRPLAERVPELLAGLNPAQLLLVRNHCWSIYATSRGWSGDLRIFCSAVIERE